MNLSFLLIMIKQYFVTFLCTQSFKCHSDIISAEGRTVVVTVVDQRCCLPAV